MNPFTFVATYCMAINMKNKLYLSIFSLLLIALFSSITFRHFYCSKRATSMPDFLQSHFSRVDSIEKSLDFEQKLLGCFIISNDNLAATQNIIRQGMPAGILLEHSKRSEVKDELAGLHVPNQNMFLAIKSIDEFERSIGSPLPLVRGAVNNDSAISQLGAATGKELKECGVNLVFSNDLLHCLSPSPSAHSYHASIEAACTKAAAYQDGLATSGRVIYLSDLSRADRNNRPEQICHLIKEFRDRKLPAVLGSNETHQLNRIFLKKTLKDSLDYKGLLLQTLHKKCSKAQLKSMLSNADFFLVNASDFEAVFDAVRFCIKDSPDLKSVLEQSFRRTLMARYWANGRSTSGLKSNLELNKRLIIEKSLVYLGEKEAIPMVDINKKNILVLTNDSLSSTFVQTLRLYSKVDQRVFHQAVLMDSIERISSKFHRIIVLPRGKEMIGLLKDLAKKCRKKQLIVYVNADAGILADIPKEEAAILFSISSGLLADQLAAQALFGGIPILGRLPYRFAGFRQGDGYSTDKLRLKYSIPEELGIKSIALARIDSLVHEAISQKAFPGCQVLLAKDGVVFYHKAFGTTTYQDAMPVTCEHVYDLASVTKIAATVPSLMRLSDEGKFKANAKVSSYLKELKGTDKGDLLWRELLLHEAGLPPWMPYFSKIFVDKKNKNLKPEFFSKTKTKTCSIQISDHLFLNPAFEDTFLRSVFKVKLKDNKKYEYTDLGYYFLKEAVERITKSSLDRYTEQNFFVPIGAGSLSYHPLVHQLKSKIVPTEFDKLFRNELVHAYTHDPGAALMGDVAGHAGLFSNANDLAKLMQLYLQLGTYGGHRYFSKKTVLEFTQPKTQKDCTRGLGFDKQRGGPISPMVSPLSYGHTGFTGTVAWNDPMYNLVYIFLSNRVYPDASNNKLLELAIRKKIQEVVYRALKE